jgi:putative flavoprotein involved in K+ transport
MAGSGALDGTHRTCVVIGGGQAGLAMSHFLTGRGVDHVVLEKHDVGHEWRTRRWDSFCLVTPNWQCRLPGFPYAGSDPDGFMVRDDVVAYLQAYATSFAVPLHEGVEATRLRRRTEPSGAGDFEIRTTAGTLTAEHVVLATGPYQVPRVPRAAERLPAHVVQLHSSRYRNPAQLPDGDVLVVGTGQSGCQIAEDLHLAGRRVHLATGSAPRVARRYRGRDVVAWLDLMGYYRKAIADFADADAVRFRANHYVTGRGGGHDIDLRAFAREGMRLYGRLTDVRGGFASFAGDLRQNLDGADAVSESIKDSIDEFIATRGIAASAEPRHAPVWTPRDEAQGRRLDLEAGVSAVIWCTGFGRDHRWIDLPVFDGRGYPAHDRGVTSCPGLYVLGLPWLHTWGSGRFCGVGDDAAHLADRITRSSVRPATFGVQWIAGTAESTYPDDDWVAPRTVA